MNDAASSQAADLVIHNAVIRTMRSEDDVADAVAVKWGRVVSVGGGEEVQRFAGPGTAMVDLGGAALLPGFTDPHVHLENPARYDRFLDSARSRSELLESLRSRIDALPRGAWSITSGSIGDPAIRPTRADLDAIGGGRPVALTFGGAESVLNSRALEFLSLDAAREQEAQLDRDPGTGELTGVVRMKGSNTLQMLMPDAPIAGAAEVRRSLLQGMGILAAGGITMIHHMIKGALPVQIYQDLYASNELPIRVGLLLRGYESEFSLDEIIRLGIRQGFGNAWLNVQGVKISVDGYFPQGGACFNEPYADQPDDSGRLRVSADELDSYIGRAHAAGLRCAVHANGDRAIDLALDAFEAALSASPRDDHRHRLEHVGNLHLTDVQIRRIKASNLVAVPNPPFIERKAHFMEARLGPERARYPVGVKRLLDAGALVSAASDFSGMYPPDPLTGIALLTTRTTSRGDVFAPDQAISTWDALRLYTSVPAWLSFTEARRGTVEVGKSADFAVISRDPMAVPAEDILGCEVQATVVGGHVAFVNEESQPGLAGVGAG